jgi:hypothetical protein
VDSEVLIDETKTRGRKSRETVLLRKFSVKNKNYTYELTFLRGMDTNLEYEVERLA